jgi:hypothetical protein
MKFKFAQTSLAKQKNPSQLLFPWQPYCGSAPIIVNAATADFLITQRTIVLQDVKFPRAPFHPRHTHALLTMQDVS